VTVTSVGRRTTSVIATPVSSTTAAAGTRPPSGPVIGRVEPEAARAAAVAPSDPADVAVRVVVTSGCAAPATIGAVALKVTSSPGATVVALIPTVTALVRQMPRLGRGRADPE
jgi:hypothetical protein